jgi:hypothetical protein
VRTAAHGRLLQLRLQHLRERVALAELGKVLAQLQPEDVENQELVPWHDALTVQRHTSFQRKLRSPMTWSSTQ